MGWRDRLDVILKDCWEGAGCSDEERDAALLDMPPAEMLSEMASEMWALADVEPDAKHYGNGG